jgi:hypothetical protein
MTPAGVAGGDRPQEVDDEIPLPEQHEALDQPIGMGAPRPRTGLWSASTSAQPA